MGSLGPRFEGTCWWGGQARMPVQLALGARLELVAEDGEDHQVGEGEEEMASGSAGGLRGIGGAGEEAEVLQSGEIADFIEGGAEEAGHLDIGKDLLAGTNAQHAGLHHSAGESENTARVKY